MNENESVEPKTPMPIQPKNIESINIVPINSGYIIEQSGDGIITGRNKSTGVIEFSGSDAYTIIQGAIDDLLLGGETGSNLNSADIEIRNSGIPYVLNDTLINDAKRLILKSNGAILMPAKDMYAIQISGAGSEELLSSVEGFIIACNGESSGIQLTDCYSCSVRDVIISKPISGIVLESGMNDVTQSNIMDNIRISDPIQNGIRIGSSDQNNRRSYDNNVFRDITIDMHTPNSFGFHIMSSSMLHSSKVDGVHIWFYNHPQWGIKFETNCLLPGVMIRNTHVENKNKESVTDLTGLEFTKHGGIPNIIPKLFFEAIEGNTRIRNDNNQAYVELGE